MGWIAASLAAEIGLVGVHDGGLDDAAQLALAQSMAAAIEEDGVHDALLPTEVAARYAGREDLVLQDGLLADGRRMKEDGRLLYQQAQVEDAVFALEQATKVLDEGARWARSVRDLWEAWMLLATARLADGDEPGARDAIGDALAVHGQRRPDPAVFPPEVIELFENERQLAEEEVGRLTITVPPDVDGANVRIWLDGRDVGAAPAQLRDVMPGSHHVHAATPDGRVAWAKVDLAQGAERTQLLTFQAPALPPAAKTVVGRSAQIGALYRALGRYARLDLILIAGRVDGGMQLQLYAPEAASYSAPVVLPSSASNADIVAAVHKLVSNVGKRGELPPSDTAWTALPLDLAANHLLARDLYTPIPQAPSTPPPDPTEPPSQPQTADRPKWPMWLGIGLGAVAVGAGATALGLALGKGGDGAPPATGTIVIGPPVSR